MRRLPIPLLPTWLRWSGVLAVAAVIFYFSILTAVPAPEGPPGPFWDKKLHFAAYGAFTLALAYATADWRSKRTIRISTVLLIGLLYGAGIEVLQGFLPNRYFGIDDMLANLLGALLASVWFVLEPRLSYVSSFDDRHSRG